MQIFQIKSSPFKGSKVSFSNAIHYVSGHNAPQIVLPRPHDSKSFMEMSLDDLGKLLNRKRQSRR